MENRPEGVQQLDSSASEPAAERGGEDQQAMTEEQGPTAEGRHQSEEGRSETPAAEGPIQIVGEESRGPDGDEDHHAIREDREEPGDLQMGRGEPAQQTSGTGMTLAAHGWSTPTEPWLPVTDPQFDDVSDADSFLLERDVLDYAQRLANQGGQHLEVEVVHALETLNEEDIAESDPSGVTTDGSARFAPMPPMEEVNPVPTHAPQPVRRPVPVYGIARASGAGDMPLLRTPLQSPISPPTAPGGIMPMPPVGQFLPTVGNNMPHMRQYLPPLNPNMPYTVMANQTIPHPGQFVPGVNQSVPPMVPYVPPVPLNQGMPHMGQNFLQGGQNMQGQYAPLIDLRRLIEETIGDDAGPAEPPVEQNRPDDLVRGQGARVNGLVMRPRRNRADVRDGEHRVHRQVPLGVAGLLARGQRNDNSGGAAAAPEQGQNHGGPRQGVMPPPNQGPDPAPNGEQTELVHLRYEVGQCRMDIDVMHQLCSAILRERSASRNQEASVHELLLNTVARSRSTREEINKIWDEVFRIKIRVQRQIVMLQPFGAGQQQNAQVEEAAGQILNNDRNAVVSSAGGLLDVEMGDEESTSSMTSTTRTGDDPCSDSETEEEIDR